MIIKNTDENKGEPIHFKEERENLQPSTEFLAMEICWKILCPPNTEEEIALASGCLHI